MPNTTTTTIAPKAGKIAKALRTAAERVCLEMLEDRVLMSTWYVSNSGSDGGGSGSITSPWSSVQKAVNVAAPGDVINLRGGTYNGKVSIDEPNITIQSYPGEKASIKTSYNDSSSMGTIMYGLDASGGKLLNLDISGGYYYTIKTDSNWDTGASREYGTSNLLIDGCKIHDSGRDVIKLTPGSNYITIRNSEIYNSGRRDPSNAEGIDAVNSNYSVVQDSYIHDTTTNGIYYKGGSAGTVIERNRLNNIAYSGIILGQSSDDNWFNDSTNPQHYESIDGVVRNNYVTNTKGAGIAAWAALRPKIYNNTLVNVAQTMFGGFLITSEEHWIPQDVMVSSKDVTFSNNIVVVNSGRPVVDIRDTGLTGTLTMSNNRYYQGSRTPQFWDERSGFQGTLSSWQSAERTDYGSSTGDPGVDSTGHLFSSSPCINTGATIAAVTNDIDKQSRPAGGAYDIGADEYGGSGTTTPTPPTTPTTPTTYSLPLNSSQGWVNQPLPAQTSDFTVQLSAKPTQAGEDTVIGLSNGSAGNCSQLAVMVRFNSSGKIDARNGGAYAAQNSVSYSAGTTYQFKLVVHMAQHTYDVYVTPQGGSQVLIGQGYAFRTEQASTSTLNNIAKYNEVGDAAVSSITLGSTTPGGTTGTGNGLTAQYFNNSDFTGLYATRTDSTVNYNWGTNTPISGMGNTTYSVRWSGYVQPKYSETYTFYTNSDDGIRVWVNGQLLINNWTLHAPTVNSGTITLQAGQKYSIKVEYYQNTGGAVAQLSWSSPTQVQQIIPQSQLFTA